MAFWNRFPYSNFHEINLDWIIREMKKISGSVSDFARHWEKALKQETGERQEADRQLQVAPRAGAWIEIRWCPRCRWCPRWVAPRAGAWIEIRASSLPSAWRRSLPVRERGLK